MKLYLLKNETVQLPQVKPLGQCSYQYVNEKVPVQLSPKPTSKKLEKVYNVCSDLSKSVTVSYMQNNPALVERITDIWNLKVVLYVSRYIPSNETITAVGLEGKLLPLISQYSATMKPRLVVSAKTYTGPINRSVTHKWKTVESDIAYWLQAGGKPLPLQLFSTNYLPSNIQIQQPINYNSVPACHLTIQIILDDVDKTPADSNFNIKSENLSSCSKRRKTENDEVPTVTESSSDLTNFTRQILQDESTSDTILVAANGAAVKCHKSFLVVHSTVIKEILGESAKFEDPLDQFYTNRVDMNDMSEVSIRAFLAFIYCRDITETQKYCGVVFDLLKAGSKYKIQSLIDSMKSIFVEKDPKWFNIGVALDLYLICSRQQWLGKELKQKSIEVLKTKHVELKSYSKFTELFQKEPETAKELCLLVCSLGHYGK